MTTRTVYLINTCREHARKVSNIQFNTTLDFFKLLSIEIGWIMHKVMYMHDYALFREGSINILSNGF